MVNLQVWTWAEDLPAGTAIAVLVLATLSLIFLAVELRRRERFGVAIATTGILAVAALSLAVLRPIKVSTRGTAVGPRMVVLMDESRRLDLPVGNRSRRERAEEALSSLKKHFGTARLSVFGFDSGDPRSRVAGEALRAPSQASGSGATEGSTVPKAVRRRSSESDLEAALDWLRTNSTEAPQSIVIVSDGRFSRPGSGASPENFRDMLGKKPVPIHTVAVVREAPPDASIRDVQAAGAAVAHQALSLKIDVGCSGGLSCTSIPVRVRELRQGGEPALLATGTAEVVDGAATLELRITLDRAGPRLVEIAIDSPPGDQVPENDTRILSFDVTRDRVRLLHVAGRPTYDVRALRTWLKSDASVDLIGFFILRDESDTPGAEDSELALIPFPVDELFTEHLASFDAVILQDIDAVTYKISSHLRALANYVEAGGGLIMVGGPSAFAGGRYAGTALNRVLPVGLQEEGKPFDVGDFAPTYTEAGKVAPVLRALRDIHGDSLPPMPGANILGPPRPRSVVLWQHPTLTQEGHPMPVLALGEAGDGRTIALGVDGTHGLAFSEFAAGAGGRGYGALWDGLLGWLMREPRYESVRAELLGECVAGEPAILRLWRVPNMPGDVQVTLERLGVPGAHPQQRTLKAPLQGVIEVDLGVLAPGGYSARIQVGAAPPARRDFACERGGDAWRDSRPDPDRLARLSDATGGRAVGVEGIDQLPLPTSTQVAAERQLEPVLPSWFTSLLAALALGAHWVMRRQGGLS